MSGKQFDDVTKSYHRIHSITPTQKFFLSLRNHLVFRFLLRFLRRWHIATSDLYFVVCAGGAQQKMPFQDISFFLPHFMNSSYFSL